ncbi:MAG TPA: Hpt domain-containing protein [Mycobacteriales bacterium]|nr:Hpt domain-containing protein [Mycobacteriales bacterium]
MGGEGARGALPEDVTRSLREAFGTEVALRLPPLRSADPQAVLHAAHALASSAWVVGEREVSLLARAVEDQLLEGVEATDLPALVAALEGLAP